MQVSIRRLEAEDLIDADRIMRLAFGTFNALDEPLSFMGDGDFVRPRWHADPQAAFGMDVDGRLAGSVFLCQWGSFAFFGPLSIDPAFWGQGLVHHLMAAVMAHLDSAQITLAGLYTFPHSLQHIGLYQKYGFRPRMLTTLFVKPVVEALPASGFDTFGGLAEPERDQALAASRRLANGVYDGLDLTNEILALDRQALGDTLLLRDANGDLTGFAVCHHGIGSEGGSTNCYVKFAAVTSGAGAEDRFERLLDTVTAYARRRGAMQVVAGVNAGRREAYERMLSMGFGLWRTGIAMHRPNGAGFSRPGVFVIDDWR